MQLNEFFEFQNQYCDYYHVLEDDFCETEKYLTVDRDNFEAYSNEFVRQIQAICSEIDVTLKVLCKMIDQNFAGESFPQYCKCILDYNPLFDRATVFFSRSRLMMLVPWLGWKYIEPPPDNPKAKLQSTNPEWWTIHNKIKHDRTAVNPKSKKPYYKHANQENVLNALSALFIIVSCIMHFSCKTLPDKDAAFFMETWYRSSKIFSGSLYTGFD